MSFQLEIVTPKGLFLKQEIDAINIKTITGYRTILDGHTDLLAVLDYAPMHIIYNNKTTYYAIHGGLLRMENNVLHLVLGAIERADQIDLKRAEDSKMRAETRLSKPDENTDLKRAELALKRAATRIETIKYI